MYMALVAPLVGKTPVPPLEWDREQLKNQVEEAIRRLGGVVHGGSMGEMCDQLVDAGDIPDGTPVRQIHSSLWHLTKERVLEYHGRKPEGLCPTSENGPRHCYRLVHS
jgi:hypothetical protein